MFKLFTCHRPSLFRWTDNTRSGGRRKDEGEGMSLLLCLYVSLFLPLSVTASLSLPVSGSLSLCLSMSLSLSASIPFSLCPSFSLSHSLSVPLSLCCYLPSPFIPRQYDDTVAVSGSSCPYCLYSFIHLILTVSSPPCHSHHVSLFVCLCLCPFISVYVSRPS